MISGQPLASASRTAEMTGRMHHPWRSEITHMTHSIVQTVLSSRLHPTALPDAICEDDAVTAGGMWRGIVYPLSNSGNVLLTPSPVLARWMQTPSADPAAIIKWAIAVTQGVIGCSDNPRTDPPCSPKIYKIRQLCKRRFYLSLFKET